MPSDEQHEPVSYGLISSGLVFAVSAAIFSTYFVQQFTSVFEGFGVSLPVLTRFVLDYYLAAWLLPLIVLVVAVSGSGRAACGRRCLIIGVFSGIVVFLLVLVAMYLPIFRMGSTVS